jgi:anthranilate synthase component 1
MVARLSEPAESLLALPPVEPDTVPFTRQRSEAEFAAAVREAVEDIKSGEAFQIVVSQRFEAPCDADALDVYRVLRLGQPQPRTCICCVWRGSASWAPARRRSSRSQTDTCSPTPSRAPNRGGRRRSRTPRTRPRLRSDPKETCRNTSCSSTWGRNDLGRVCVPGTVTVVEFMQVRRYSHIMHLESTVTGTLSPGRTALEATLSCFPAGTLSGAPKVRAMEIIDRLETSRRGLYGGVVGYFDFAGNSDVAIAIRTAVLKGGRAFVQAGGGIVADSVPASEDLESRNKAAAALRAVAVAAQVRRLGDAG